MSKTSKILGRVLSGTSDANFGFGEVRALLTHLGFVEWIRGGHHIFTRDDIPEILNLQPRGGQAKAYQVKQVREVIVNRGLAAPDQREESGDE